MAHFFRLAVALLLFAGGSAHALVPVVQGWSAKSSNYGNNGAVSGVFAAKADACADLATKYPAALAAAGFPNRTATLTVNNGTSCVYNVTGSGNDTISFIASSGCPANSTASGSACLCKSGFQENAAHSACVPIPTASEKWKGWCQAAAGQSLGFAEMPGRNVRSGCQNLTLAGSPISTPGYVAGEVPQDAGCTVTLGNMRSFPNADGSWYTQGDANISGGTCREGDPAAGDPAGTEKQPEAKPPKCVGGYEGSVNGASVCAKPDTTKGIDWAGTKTETKSDGTTKTTETNTNCKDGNCSTTTKETTRDGTGAIIGTNTTTTKESAGSLCSRDKGNGACTATGAGGAGGGEGDGNSFGGSCASGFKAVSEDAVINAMAEEQYKRNCQFFEKVPDPTEDTQAHDEMRAKGKQGVDQTADLPASSRREVTIGPGDFDYSSAIGPQQCFTDRSVSIWGRSVAIPLSIVCPWLEILGNILVVVGSLLAARIVVRG